jgi:uncharacterized membrane protein
MCTEFGVWLVLALEFELGALIVRVVISPGQTEVGAAAVGCIRTSLNFFKARDLENYTKTKTDTIRVRSVHEIAR